MIDIITTIAKYLIIIMCLIYTLSCYTVFRPKNKDRKEDLLDNQVIYMFVFLFLCYTVLFLQEFELKILIFFAAQVIFFEILMIVFPRIYKRCSRPLINNTCFLLGVGFVILTRLSFNLAMKQFAIAAGSVIVTSFIPLMMHKITIWNKFGWLYAVAGFTLLSTVFVFGINKYGAYNWVSIAGLKFQPSEFVKIIFVFFVAALLSKAKEFKDLVKITVIAALYVLVLVVEKDLGGALLYFVIYLMMLYVATAKASYLFGGLAAGSVAAIIADKIFTHVQIRVAVWKDPFSMIEGRGLQVCQSLFAIGTGSWFGMGLGNGWTVEDHLAYRQSYAPDILQDLLEKLEEISSRKDLLPKSTLAQAVGYALNEYNAICDIFKKGDTALDNNYIERIQRYISLSRRNSMFFGSHEGARRGAILYSIAISCRLNGINLFEYICDVIEKTAEWQPNTPLEKYRDLLPDRWKKQ